MKKFISVLLSIIIIINITACATTDSSTGTDTDTNSTLDNKTLVYGSGDYTRINPAMDEHGRLIYCFLMD